MSRGPRSSTLRARRCYKMVRAPPTVRDDPGQYVHLTMFCGSPRSYFNIRTAPEDLQSCQVSRPTPPDHGFKLTYSPLFRPTHDIRDVEGTRENRPTSTTPLCMYFDRQNFTC